MTKEESLYQAKLILEQLDFEEYRKIPDEIWNYIEDNMQYSENISIDPNKPLDEQNIDTNTIKFLEKVYEQIEKNKDIFPKSNVDNEIQQQDIAKYSEEELTKIVKMYEKQKENIQVVKKVMRDYETALKQKSVEIENLAAANNEMIQTINKCPKLVKVLFFRKFNRELPSRNVEQHCEIGENER